MAQTKRFLQWFDLNGRIGRLPALVYTLVTSTVVLTWPWLLAQTGLSLRLFAPLLALLIVGQYLVLVWRLHDANRSGYWALLALVPLVNIVAYVAIIAMPTREGWTPPLRRPVSHLFAYAAFAFLLALGFGRIFYQPFWSPSGSMEPTLLVGDYYVVPLGGVSDLERGAIVVFQHPVNGQNYVKRVIGLPGDEIQLVDGVVGINGVSVELIPNGKFATLRAPDGAARLTEVLPDGTRYDILDIEMTAQDDTGVFQVPPGYIFVLGDNRDDSTDSRFPQAAGGMGFIPIANIKGQISRVLFSADGGRLAAFWTWRRDRFFLDLQ